MHPGTTTPLAPIGVLATVRATVIATAIASVLAAGPAAGAARAEDEKPEPAPAETAAPHPLEGFWELRMERALWWPYLVPGSLAVTRTPKGLRGSLTFDPMWGIDPKPVVVDPAAGDRIRFTLDLGREENDDREVVTGTVRDGVLTGQIEWTGASPRETCFISASRARERRLEPDASPDPFPLETDPAKVGIDPSALDRLIHYAGKYDTDALVVVKDGRVVCDRTFLRPRGLCATDAITATVAAFAIPLLVEDGKLPRDLDTPLVAWFPDWKADARKSRITLRHVLTHTSGLAYAKPGAEGDYLADAASAVAAHEPGEHVEYGSQALELLSGVIAKASGEQADTYLDRRLFRPLGVKGWRWPRDRAGNVLTYSGLDLRARDLARIGALVADRGRVQDAQVVPAWWFDEIAAPSAGHEELGLLWSLRRAEATETVVQTQAKLDLLAKSGWPDAQRLAPLVGETFPSRRAWWLAVSAAVGRDGTKRLYERIGDDAVGGELRGPVECVHATAALGQYLIVFPAQRLVVVRQRRGFAENELPEDVAKRAVFHDLRRLAADLLLR